MTVVMWIVLWLLWTVLMLIAGYYSGYENHKKEASEGRFNVELETAEGTPVLQGPPGPMGMSGKDGEPGPPGPPGKTPDADALIIDKNLDLTLSEWRASVESRLTRVERKSGMRV